MKSISRGLVCAVVVFASSALTGAQQPTAQTRDLQVLQEQLLNTAEDFNQLRDAVSSAGEKTPGGAAERLGNSAASAHLIATAASDLIIISGAMTCAADRATAAELVSARWVRYGGTLQSLGRSVDREIAALVTVQSDSEIVAIAKRYRTQLTEIEKILRTAMAGR